MPDDVTLPTTEAGREACRSGCFAGGCGTCWATGCDHHGPVPEDSTAAQMKLVSAIWHAICDASSMQVVMSGGEVNQAIRDFRSAIEAEATTALRQAVLEVCDNEDYHVGGAAGDYGEIVVAVGDVRKAAGLTDNPRPHGADFAINNRDLRAAAEDAEERATALRQENERLRGRLDVSSRLLDLYLTGDLSEGLVRAAIRVNRAALETK